MSAQNIIQSILDKRHAESEDSISIELPDASKIIREATSWYEELCRSRNESITLNPSAMKSRAVFLYLSQYERLFDHILRSDRSSTEKHRLQRQVSKNFESDLDKITAHFGSFPNESEVTNVARMKLPCLGTCGTHYGIYIDPDIIRHYIDTLKSNPKLEASFDWSHLERLAEERLICSQSYHILMCFLNDSTFNFAERHTILKDSMKRAMEHEPLCWLCNIIYEPLNN